MRTPTNIVNFNTRSGRGGGPYCYLKCFMSFSAFASPDHVLWKMSVCPKRCFLIVPGFGEDGCKVNQIHTIGQILGRKLMGHYLIRRL